MRYISEDFARSALAAEEYAGMLEAIRAQVDQFMEAFSDDPQSMSRWGHRYFCEEDGGALVFDLQSPYRHRCRVCGKAYDGEALHGAWVCFYRNQAILTAWKAAAVFAATRDEAYLRHAVRVISFYADNYPRFRPHNKEDEVFDSTPEAGRGCGKVMPQGLNEAIFLCRAVQALEILGDDLPPGFLRGVQEGMFREAYRLLRPQVNAVHNICCWELAAIGMMGLLCGDREMTDFAFSSEYNIRRQLREGVTADGFWYEGSIHYNFFLLEGVTLLMLFCGVYGHDFGEEAARTVEHMLLSAYGFAFDNGMFPNPNDGWPDVGLKTYLHVYHVAARYFGGESPVAGALRRIEGTPGERVSVPLSETCYWRGAVPLERLLLGPALDISPQPHAARASYNFPLSNFAMLRRGALNVFLKYGLNGPSHAHPDIMNIEIAWGDHLVSRDLSNAGYQSRLCNRWHRTTLCHNTVVVDGLSIESTRPGECLRFSDDAVEALARDVYPGVDYRRALALGDGSLLDAFDVTTQSERVFDYVFHLEPGYTLAEIPPVEPAAPGFDGNGYEYLRACVLVRAQDECVALRAVRGDRAVTLRFDLSGGKRLYIAQTPDNPQNKTRGTFLVRAHGKEAAFRTSFAFEDGFSAITSTAIERTRGT